MPSCVPFIESKRTPRGESVLSKGLAHDDSHRRGELHLRCSGGLFIRHLVRREEHVNPTLKAYEPPTCMLGAPCNPGSLELLAPGVHGYAVPSEDEIFIPMIIAEKEGSGDVGRFLDVLSRRCVVVNVTSSRLEGMLVRRGWKKVMATDPDLGGEIDEWRRA